MIDKIVVATYFIVVFIVGLINKSRVNSLYDYGRVDSRLQNRLLLLVMAIFASAVGGGTVFGIAEKACSRNLAYTYTAILTIPFDILLGILIVPRLSKYYGSVSTGDITAQFYGKIGRVVTGISAALVSFGYVAAQINVSGKILHHIIGFDYLKAIVLSYIITTISIFLGGFRAVLATGALQVIIMVIGILLLAFTALREVNISNFFASIPINKVSLKDQVLLYDTLGLVISFSILGLYPSLIQRCLINKQHAITSKAILIKSACYAIFILIITLNGLLAHYLSPEMPAAEAICHMINTVMSPGLKGLVLIGFLSATMSTAAAELNIVSISVVNDILKPLTKLDNKQAVNIARGCVLISGGVAVGLAFHFENVIDLVMFIAGFWLPVMLVPLVAALYDVVISKTGFVSSAFAGVSCFVLWYLFCADARIKPVFVGTAANLVIFLLFYFISKNTIRLHHSN